MDAKLTYSMLYLWIISLISSLTVNCLIAKQQTRFPSLNNELSIFRSRFVSIQLQDNLFFIFKTFFAKCEKKKYIEKKWVFEFISQPKEMIISPLYHRFYPVMFLKCQKRWTENFLLDPELQIYVQMLLYHQDEEGTVSLQGHTLLKFLLLHSPLYIDHFTEIECYHMLIDCWLVLNMKWAVYLL